MVLRHLLKKPSSDCASLSGQCFDTFSREVERKDVTDVLDMHIFITQVPMQILQTYYTKSKIETQEYIQIEILICQFLFAPHKDDSMQIFNSRSQ